MKRGTTSLKAAQRSGSVAEGASGEGDQPMRCKYNTMDAKLVGFSSVDARVSKDAVATGRKAVKGHRVTGRKVGKDRPVRNVSKSKAGAASCEAKMPGAAASAAVGVTKMENHAAAEAVAAEAGTAGKEGGLRLSQEYIDFVLSWKPEVFEDPDEYYARLIKIPTFSRDYVERSTKLQRELVEQSKECAASVESFHAWVRAEYMEKGYVEVNDDYIAQGVELRQALEEDEEYARAFGPMDGVVAEGEDDKFALAGPIGVVL